MLKSIRLAYVTGLISLLLLLSGCSSTPTPAATPTPPIKLTLYNWAEYMPQSVLDAFTAEYGIEVDYVAYTSPEEAVENVKKGGVYDVVVLPPEYLPELITNDWLAIIDHDNVPNFKNISANFRDLAYDPGNHYSIPFHWGVSGLLVRTDLVDPLPTRWADLWDPRFAGRVALWPLSGSLLSVALKSLGYSANSTDPQELDAAVQHLEQIIPHAIWWDPKAPSIVPALTEGGAVITFGWAYDALVAREQSVPVSFILPEDGSLLWSDYFVIPASSPHKPAAELFLNFVLRPEISAQLINESYYAMANDAAEPLVAPEILADPVIYPPNDFLRNAEVIMPLDASAKDRYSAAWEKLEGLITAP